MPDPGQQTSQFRFISLGNYLHPAVIEIRYITGQPEFLSAFPGVVPEEDTLHPPRDQDVNSTILIYSIQYVMTQIKERRPNRLPW